MSQRMPLKTLHNECSTRQKVRQTYGKKGKASAALLGTKDFFKMTNELENKLAAINISKEDDHGEKGNKESVEPVPTKEQSNMEHKKRVRPRARPRPRDQRRTLSEDFDTSSIELDASGLSDTSPDQRAIEKFAAKHSSRPVLSFRAYGDAIGKYYDIEKIGEGSFSSVFAATRKMVAQLPHDTKMSHPQTTIIKLIPIALFSQAEDNEANRRDMTDLSALASEVQTLDAMDSVHGFISYRDILVMKGSWPTNFLDAFRKYKTEYSVKAHHEDPEKAFTPPQYFALIEMGYAGVELDIVMKRPSEFQIYDIFWSVCIHLANSEVSAQFEHRDMHVSNICVKAEDPSIERIDVDEAVVANMKVKPEAVFGMTNIATTIIDYTYSRLKLPSRIDPDRGSNYLEFRSEDDYNACVEKFVRMKSDRGVRYEELAQNLTYAKVTKCVDDNFTRQEAGQDGSHTGVPPEAWEHHLPQSNVCWLGYLLKVLRSRAGRGQRTKYVVGSNAVAKELQDDIRGRLVALAECVFNHDIDQMPKSANDVVRLGVDNGWLLQKDIDVYRECEKRKS